MIAVHVALLVIVIVVMELLLACGVGRAIRDGKWF